MLDRIFSHIDCTVQIRVIVEDGVSSRSSSVEFISCELVEASILHWENVNRSGVGNSSPNGHWKKFSRSRNLLHCQIK